MNVLDLAIKNVILKKVSTTNGGEWQGPCPGCGGTDRFHVWPEQNQGRGGYWCRVCQKSGDNIQYLRDFQGLSFQDACAQLGIETKDREILMQTRPTSFDKNPSRKQDFVPTAPERPNEIWQEKAGKFVSWAHEILMNDEDKLAWLAARGIPDEAAAWFRLGWNPGEDGKDIYRPRKSWGLPEELKENGKPKAIWIPRGLVIPYIESDRVIRIRIRRSEGEPRYYVLPGSSSATMIINRESRAFVVVESELDAITCASASSLAGAIALGSAAAKPDMEAFTLLQKSLAILNALDYDAAGRKAYEWWGEQFPRCVRWPVPEGKDPGDAFGSGIALDKWIKIGLPPALTLTTPEMAGRREPKILTETPRDAAESVPDDLPAEIRELYKLLRDNPRVEIINQPGRYTVLRDGKYVGGRINELVFRETVTRDYLMDHPARRITWKNLIVN